MTWLKSKGMNVESFFSKHLITGSHDRAIEAVRSGMVDGAAVDSLVFRQLMLEDPSLTNEVQIVQQSDSFGMPPLVVPEGLDSGLADGLKEVLMQMHEEAEGRSILKALSIDRFADVEASAYDSVRQLVIEWEGQAQE